MTENRTDITGNEYDQLKDKKQQSYHHEKSKEHRHLQQQQQQQLLQQSEQQKLEQPKQQQQHQKEQQQHEEQQHHHRQQQQQEQHKEEQQNHHQRQQQQQHQQQQQKQRQERQQHQQFPRYNTFRKRLNSFRSFLSYFYIDQNDNPFHALIGPGPGPTKTFTFTHLWYIIIVSFIPVCGLLSTLGFIQPYLASDNSLCDWKKEPRSCEVVIVVFITYRIGFSTTVFFLFTALILGRTQKNDQETPHRLSTLHTGFWIEKVIIVLVLSCVSFAFPPVIFDMVWLYLVLLGDAIITCIMVFLLCDLVSYFHYNITYYIENKKLSSIDETFITHAECTFAILAMIGFLLASVYTTSISENVYMTVHVVIFTIYMTGQIIYTILNLKKELVRVLYATVFVYILLWITTVNHRQYLGNQVYGVWSPSNILPLVLLYIVLMYALTRKEEMYQFYYFRWTISSWRVRFNGKHFEYNASKHYTANGAYCNLNDTLIDQPPPPQQSYCKTTEQKIIHGNNIMYKESFIHLLFAALSLKTTAAVTNYKILINDEHGQLRSTTSYQSIVTTYISTVFVVILFTGYLYRVHTSKHYHDSLSIGLLLTSMTQKIYSAISTSLFSVPKSLRHSALCRYVYSLFFVLVFIMAYIGISLPRKYLEQLSVFCDHVTVLGKCMSHDPAFILLYRIFGTVGTFFSILSMVTIDVYPFSKFRLEIHKGCWLVKLIVLFLVLGSIANLPNSQSRYWLYLSLLSILVVILLQLYCLLDAVSLIKPLIATEKDGQLRKIKAGSASLTLLLYGISITAYICFYIFYTHNHKCAVTRFFVCVNVVLCITASLVSIHPIIQNGNLLVSSIVTTFCMYNTWSGLNYNPEEQCNPMAHNFLLMEIKPSRDIVALMDLALMFIMFLYYNIRIAEMSKKHLQYSCLTIILRFIKRRHQKFQESQTPCTNDNMDSERKEINDDKLRIEQWLTHCKSPEDETNQPADESNSHNSSQIESLISKPTIEIEDDNQFESHENKDNPEKENTHNANDVTVNANENKTNIQNNHTTVNDNKDGKINGNENKTNVHDHDTRINESSHENNKINENDTTNTQDYSYSFLHFVCQTVCSYSFLILSHWLEAVPGSGFKITLNWTIMSVKLVSSTICVLVYVWYMMVPLFKRFQK